MQHSTVFLSDAVAAELCARFTGLSEADVRCYVDRAADDLVGSVASDDAFPEMVIRLAAHRIDQDAVRGRRMAQPIS